MTPLSIPHSKELHLAFYRPQIACLNLITLRTARVDLTQLARYAIQCWVTVKILAVVSIMASKAEVLSEVSLPKELLSLLLEACSFCRRMEGASTLAILLALSEDLMPLEAPWFTLLEIQTIKSKCRKTTNIPSAMSLLMQTKRPKQPHLQTLDKFYLHMPRGKMF